MTTKFSADGFGGIGRNVNSEESKPESTLLIVGDWVIDEYWFLVRHHSDISTHIGYAHYRIINEPPSDIIRGLCGAGHVARVLFKLKEEKKDMEINLYGIGNWNEKDTMLISHLVHDCESAKVSKKMGTIDVCNQPLNLTLTGFTKNPAKAYYKCNQPLNLTLTPINPDSHTIRVIRLYHHVKEGLEQINRVDFDWEQKNDSSKASLPNELPETVSMIIVQDLRKGCVTKELIKELNNKYKKASWCVRRKSEEIDWLAVVKDKVVLQFICPDISQLLNPWGSWLFENHPSRQAIEIIDSYKKKGIKNIVLSSYNREVVALFNNNLYVGKSLVKPTLLNQLGWADAVYASLIFKILEKRKQDLKKEDLEFALEKADEHLAIKVPEKMKLELEKRKPIVTEEGKWDKVKEEWNFATGKKGKSNIGIIRRKGISNLDVWRGSTELFGYIACIEEKVEILRKIGHKLRSFKKDPSPTRPLSILIQADPGSGKTSLAKALARCFGFTFVHRDITQMIHRDELVDLFDEIATKQANGANKILIFVDEINADLEGEPVYGAFLAPLEESVYSRKGGSFRLQPCAWIFAGTKLQEDPKSSNKGYKLSDFLSRMTMFVKIDYLSIKEKAKRKKAIIRKEAKLEQLYLGAFMIKQFFPDVEWISNEVLQKFYSLDPEQTPARKIRQWASALKNVQYGKVTRENCSEWEDAKWGAKDQEIVKLNFK